MSGMIFGKATITVDGQVLETEPGATLQLGGMKRTSRSSANRVVGFSEEPEPSKLECQLLLAGGQTLDTFRTATAATIAFHCDTGQEYVVTGAWCTETPQLTGGPTGHVRLVFEGPPAEEIT